MGKIRKKTIRIIIILLSIYFICFFSSTAIIIKLNWNTGIIMTFMFYSLFVILMVIITILNNETKVNIIKRYKNNPNQSFKWIAKKSGTTEAHVAYTIARLEYNEYNPIKFKTQRAQDVLEDNKEILEETYELMSRTGQKQWEKWIDYRYKLTLFKDKVKLERDNKYEWIFNGSVYKVFLRRISPGFKRQKPINFFDIQSIIYRDKSDLSRPEIYHLLILLKNKKEVSYILAAMKIVKLLE